MNAIKLFFSEISVSDVVGGVRTQTNPLEPPLTPLCTYICMFVCMQYDNVRKT